MQVPREAEKRGFAAPDCEPEIVSDEQAVDGGEWSAAEAGFAACMRKWVYAATTTNCKPTCLFALKFFLYLFLCGGSFSGYMIIRGFKLQNVSSREVKSFNLLVVVVFIFEE